MTRRDLHVAGPGAEAWEDPDLVDDFQARAAREGAEFAALAFDHLERAGAERVTGPHKVGAYRVDGAVRGHDSVRYLVLAHGNLDDSVPYPGLRRVDTALKAFARAVGLHHRRSDPLIVVTSHLPLPRSTAARMFEDLADLCGDWLVAVVATVGDLQGFRRLERLLAGPNGARGAPSSWLSEDRLCLFDGADGLDA